MLFNKNSVNLLFWLQILILFRPNSSQIGGIWQQPPWIWPTCLTPQFLVFCDGLPHVPLRVIALGESKHGTSRLKKIILFGELCILYGKFGLQYHHFIASKGLLHNSSVHLLQNVHIFVCDMLVDTMCNLAWRFLSETWFGYMGR